MFSVLDRYIGKTILNTIIMTLFLLVALSGIIKFMDQLRKVRADYDALSAALYTFLSIPKDIELFFPMAALLGALIGLGMLASHSELVVMEAAGFSRVRIAKAVMKTAIPLVLLSMAIGEWVAPIGEQTARNMRSEKIYGSSLIATQGSVWAKDGNAFIHISKVNSDNSLEGINIYDFNNGRLSRITHAIYGSFNKEDNVWTLSQVEESDLSNPEKVVGSSLISQKWHSNITPDKLGIVALEPESLSATGLYKYTQYLSSTGQESAMYNLLFWKKLLKPISVAVMMLMALSFIFGPLRSVSMGLRIITGITCGFIFYVLDNVLAKLSVVAGFTPIIGAISTSIVFFIISLYLLRTKR